MKSKTKRLLSILLAAAMTLALFAATPMNSNAADEDIKKPVTDNDITRPKAVPKNVKTGEELQLAIDEGADGTVIRLANDIEYAGQIKLECDKTITIDLNGKTLTAGMLDVKYCGNLLLLDPDNGEFNLTGKGWNFSVLLASGAKAEVTNIENDTRPEIVFVENSGGYYPYQTFYTQGEEPIFIDDFGVSYQYQNFDTQNEEPIPIDNPGGYYYYQPVGGATIYDGSELIVHGSVTSHGICINAGFDSKITVKGNINCKQKIDPVPIDNPGGYYYSPIFGGATIHNGSELIVHGNVTSYEVGIIASFNSKITVKGDVECKQKEYFAVNLGEGTEITIEGEIIVANEENYISFFLGGTKAKKDFEKISSKPGYIEYKFEDPLGNFSTSYVWVKSPMDNSRPKTPIRSMAPEEAFPFTDIEETSGWIYESVKAAWEMGLINGKTDTQFMPDDNLTYAEAVKLAACMH